MKDITILNYIGYIAYLLRKYFKIINIYLLVIHTYETFRDHVPNLKIAGTMDTEKSRCLLL